MSTKVIKDTTNYKVFNKKLLSLGLPIALQNLINFATSMDDVLLLGLIDEKSLAASNLANKYCMLFFLLLFGLSGGANVLISQFWGKNDVVSIRKVLTTMYRVLAVGVVLFSVLAIFFPYQIMYVFTDDEIVRQLGVQYLKIIGFSFIFMGFATTTLTTLRSVGTVKVAVVVYVISFIINIVCNAVLIFGAFGFPRMGIAGAAIGTLIARVFEAGITLLYMIKYDNKIFYHIKYFFQRKVGFAKRYLTTTGPILLNEQFWGIGSALISAIIGHLGSDFTAADSICNLIVQFVVITIWGVAHASSAIIGNTIGEKKYDLAQKYAKRSLFYALLLGIFASIMMMILRRPIVSIFNISDISKNYAVQMMGAYSIIVIFSAMSSVGLIGILRGGGDTMFVLVCDIIFMWIISLPLGYFASFHSMLPVASIYFILKSDEILKAISAVFRVLRGNWIHDITFTAEKASPVKVTTT